MLGVVILAQMLQRYMLSKAAVRIDGETLDHVSWRLLALPMSSCSDRSRGVTQAAGYRALRSTAPVSGFTRAADGFRLTRTVKVPVSDDAPCVSRVLALPSSPARTVYLTR